MWLDPSNWSLPMSISLFLASGLAIAVCGVMLTKRAEELARVRGLGQALVGAVFLGMVTSLAGVVTSINAALNEVAEIAVGNAVGGIAAQTTFLVLADLFYRRANLEHAAASEQNLFQGVVLVLLLAIALLASASAGYTLWKIDIFSFVLVAAYAGGLYLVSASRDNAMWIPKRTTLITREDRQPKENEKILPNCGFLLLRWRPSSRMPAGSPARRVSISAARLAFPKLLSAPYSLPFPPLSPNL